VAAAHNRIKRQLREMCNTDQHKVFFLLENVASMKNKDKETITSSLPLPVCVLPLRACVKSSKEVVDTTKGVASYSLSYLLSGNLSR
jgi:hypothetical protein